MGAARRSARRACNRHEACPSAVAVATTPASVRSAKAVIATSGSHFSQAEVFAAVESLYDDRLRPYGRIVRKRLVEIARSAGFDKVEEPDTKQLCDFCTSCSCFHVEVDANGEWSALLVHRSQDFVDIYDAHDIYPESLWIAAAEYFDSLKLKADETDVSLPGGRYSSARALRDRSLPFLEGFSLGEICHITQLAISKRMLLGYREGAVVPYDMSSSMIKRRCAEQQVPISKARTKPGSAKTIKATDDNIEIIENWVQARECLIKILDSAELVPLSNIKRISRSLYKLDFSETTLGYAKLSDLLQDPRLHDICQVRLEKRGYIVLPASKNSDQLKEEKEEDINHKHLTRGQSREQQEPKTFCENEPLDIDDASGLNGRLLVNSPFPVTPSPGQVHLDAAATDSFLQLIMPRISNNDLAPSNLTKFCPDEPLELEESEDKQQEPLTSIAATPAFTFPMCTPSPVSQNACANSLLGHRAILLPLQIAAHL